MKRILTTLFTGLITGPVVILLYAAYGLLYSVIYSKLIMPVALMYGHNLPEVPFYQWIIAVCIISVLTTTIRGINPKEHSKEEYINYTMKQIIVYISWIVAAYLINWIWL